MKYRFCVTVTVLLVFGFGIFGRGKLATYTNITVDPNFINDFSVAEIPTSFAIQDCEILKKILPESPIILKVTPVDPPEFFFKGWQQKVRIEQVFSGENLASGSEIYITFDRWKASVARKEMNLSFVNFMKDGAEYLVFLSESIGYTKDGIEVLKQIRKNNDVPVIMLTAKGEIFDKVLALELGADDYIVKPFDPKELLARVKAVSRRYTVDNQSKDIIKYEDLTIDIGAYEVIYKGNIVRLAPKELELFHFMASNPNKVFTREQLMFEVWGYDYPGDSRTVDVHVKRLREKIKGGKEWELQTVWGVGYKFEVR